MTFNVHSGNLRAVKKRDNETVAIVPSGFIRQTEIEQAVQRAQNALLPDVVRIRYSIGSDWSGEPSIFFRVLLSDAASRPNNLQELAERVTLRLIDEVKSDEFG